MTDPRPIKPVSDQERDLITACQKAHLLVADICPITPDQIQLASEALTKGLPPIPSSVTDQDANAIFHHHQQTSNHSLVKDLLQGKECPDKVVTPSEEQKKSLSEPSPNAEKTADKGPNASPNRKRGKKGK